MKNHASGVAAWRLRDESADLPGEAGFSRAANRMASRRGGIGSHGGTSQNERESGVARDPAF